MNHLLRSYVLVNSGKNGEGHDEVSTDSGKVFPLIWVDQTAFSRKITDQNIEQNNQYLAKYNLHGWNRDRLISVCRMKHIIAKEDEKGNTAV